MPNITKITVRPGLSQNINWCNNDEQDLSSQKPEPFKSDGSAQIIYDATKNQQVQTPAVIANTPSTGMCLDVTVSGLDEALINSGKLCHIALPCAEPSKFQLVSDSVPLSTLAVGATPTDRVFPVQLKSISGKTIEVPVAYWQNFWWHFVVDGESDVAMDSVLLELYILPQTLPGFFGGQQGDGVPRLLCRMFVNTATRAGVESMEDWVAHVVAICHGSRQPSFEALPQNTEGHWLKYDIWNGAPAFVHASEASVYINLGGFFALDAWLDAYRNFLALGTLTLVNCYDQGGAVEVALSLGMDTNKIGWQYHQTFGYIHESAELVGWGNCNNPYFGQNKTPKTMSGTDPKRTGFSNHVFLSWSRNFDIQDHGPVSDIFPDPRPLTDLLAIDACAGPHLGNEAVGEYMQPELQPNPRDSNPKDYWAGRDPDFDSSKPNTSLFYASTDANRKDIPGTDGMGEPKTQRHSLTPGITNIGGVKKGGVYKQPFTYASEIDWASLVPDINSSDVFTGQVSQIMDNFRGNVFGDNWAKSTSIPIANIDLGNGKTLFETKAYVPDQTPKLNFFSLRITSCNNTKDAVTELQARANHVIETSEVTGYTSQADVFKRLESDFDCLFIYKNLMLEVGGVPTDNGIGHVAIPDVAKTVYGDIQKLG